MSVREVFEALLAEKRRVDAESAAASDRRAEPPHPAVAEVTEAASRAAHGVGYVPPPLRKRRGRKATVEEMAAFLRERGWPEGADERVLDAVRAAVTPVNEKWLAHLKGLTFRSRELDVEMRRIADACEVRPGGRRLYREFWAGTYRSTGSGSHYAQSEAKLHEVRLTAAGVSTELERVERVGSPRIGPFPGSSGWTDYRLHVFVESDVDVEVLRRRTPPPMREEVRLCWKLGINPRVLNPWLPHGYEERVGIDYFGNDLRAAG